MRILPLLAASVLSITTSLGQAQSDCRTQATQEVLAAEQAFQDLAAADGVANAFRTFAAPDAVKLIGDTLLTGPESIYQSFDTEFWSNTTLSWKPDFVEVAASCDLAYTYGKYTYTTIHEDGTTRSGSGIFHTVWKKQDDGSWKFVWD